MSPDKFETETAIAGVNKKFIYYLVGTVGAGKSTILRHFGSLKVYEEWMDERPPELSKPFSELSDDEKTLVDSWTNDQFYKKNRSITQEKEGIHMVDRTPLDPITFSPDEQKMRLRASSMLKAISPGNSSFKIDMGQVILLRADPTELKTRLLAKRKTDWSEQDINTLQERSLKIYGEFGLTEIENINRPIANVVKDIARKIYVDDYKPVNLHEALIRAASDKTSNAN